MKAKTIFGEKKIVTEGFWIFYKLRKKFEDFFYFSGKSHLHTYVRTYAIMIGTAAEEKLRERRENTERGGKR